MLPTIMCANRVKMACEFNDLYPGRMGNLFSPGSVQTPRAPYAIDNGAFIAWKNGREWDVRAYLTFVEKVSSYELRPRWAVVPDAVGDKKETMSRWDGWAPNLLDWGFPLAVAVQDGMTTADVLSLSPQPSVVFVGGTMEWKWLTAPRWCRDFPRVHIARVASYRGLWQAHRLGAESTDSTSWYFADNQRYLKKYLERSSKGLREHFLKPLV